MTSIKPILLDMEDKKTVWTKAIADLRERVLAELVMLSQIPAKTYQEEERGRFMLNRFLEEGLAEPFSDELGNVVAVLKAKEAKRKILIAAHLDSIYPPVQSDLNIQIDNLAAMGSGVADNCMGLAVISILPALVNQLGLAENSDIYLLAAARSKERGDLEGLRHFINNTPERMDFCVNLEGLTLGQIDHSTLSRVRCDIRCSLLKDGEESAWRSLGQMSAIMVMNDIMDGIFRLPLSSKPKTMINIGKIEGGNSYSKICTEAKLSLEVRSEDDGVTDNLIREIEDICVDIGSKYGIMVEVDFFSRQHSLGNKFSSPIVRTATGIVRSLGLNPIMSSSNSDIAVPLSANIPSVTLGITTGDSINKQKEYVHLAPIPTGILQILMMIHALDRGTCDN